MKIIKTLLKVNNCSRFGGIKIIEESFYNLGLWQCCCIFCMSEALQYLCGMILLDKNQTIDGIAKAFGNISNDTLSLGLHYFRILDNNFFINMVKTIQSKTMEVGYLIIDDVTIIKYGKEIEVSGDIYDHVTKKHCSGFMIVVILWSNGIIKIPIAFRIWKCKSITGKDKYKSKIDLAYEMLEHIYSSGLLTKYVVYDSWYSGEPLMKKLRDSYGYNFITRIKCNRKVWYDDYPLQVKWLDLMFPKVSFRYYSKSGLYLKSLKAYLPGYGDVRICIVHRKKDSKVKDSKYIVTNMLLSTQDMLLFYATRWTIEVFFRDLKQLFGLGKSQFRKEKMINAHIQLLFIGFLICQKLKIESNFRTIGAVVRYLQGTIAVQNGEEIKIFEPMKKETCNYLERTSFWVKIST